MISFIVSVYDRPDYLSACLATLALQDVEKEILVCANHGDPDMLIACGLACEQYGARMLKTGLVGAGQCYESANMAAPEASGEWLCFPSDDSLYVQGFSRIMLATALLEKADVVYCDCVYRLGSEVGKWPAYSVLETKPVMGKIDKTCFLIRRTLFKAVGGFPEHPKFWSDGALFRKLQDWNIKKAPGVLCVHQ